MNLRFEDQKKEMKFIEDQLMYSIPTFYSAQLCLCGVFFTLFAINISNYELHS